MSRPLVRWLALNGLIHAALLAALGAHGRPMEWAWLLAWPLMGWLFWEPFVLSPLAERPRTLAAFAVLWGLWLCFATGYRFYQGTYPDHGTVEFACSEPRYGWLLFKDRLSFGMALAFAVSAAAAVFALKGLRPAHIRGRWWKLITAALALAALNRFVPATTVQPPDTALLMLATQVRARRMGAGGLRRALAREKAPQGPPPPFQVLLLVHESLNADAFDPVLMPKLAARIQSGEVAAFSEAFAPAPMTDVALPSLFSGVDPVQGSARYHHEPLLWHRAQAHGMGTALFSVQRFDYYGFPDYLLADGLDRYETQDLAGPPLRSNAGAPPLVNDAAADDGALIPWLRAWLDAEKGKPALTILHFGATHAPYFQKAGFTPFSAADVARARPEVPLTRRADLARYWNAIRYLDQVQEEALQEYARRGLLEHTLVISTSDHGENFHGPAQGRLDDVRPQTLHVPLWISLPKGFPVAMVDAMKANTGRLVSNLDIAPTLAEALGDPLPPDVQRLGSSLLAPLPQDRILLAHNGGEIRRRDPAALSLLWMEDGRLREWRWHGQEGAFAAVVRPGDGEESLNLEPGEKARITKVLAAFPFLHEVRP
ncbi:MAG TPA: sulfatase-like hydrolase/transferase [Holophagaceae bacterium]|jgi:hypothetical protein|nr:sulfatase-like hydrolase/transferase [Holophagaceae bacterium]